MFRLLSKQWQITPRFVIRVIHSIVILASICLACVCVSCLVLCNTPTAGGGACRVLHIRQKDAACVAWPWRDTRSPQSHRRAHPARDNDDCDCCDDAFSAPCAPWPAPVWAAALSLWPSWCAHACDASPARGCVSCGWMWECECECKWNDAQCEWHWIQAGTGIAHMGEVEMSLKAWPLHLLKLLVWWMAACQDKHHASDKQQT